MNFFCNNGYLNVFGKYWCSCFAVDLIFNTLNLQNISPSCGQSKIDEYVCNLEKWLNCYYLIFSSRLRCIKKLFVPNVQKFPYFVIIKMRWHSCVFTSLNLCNKIKPEFSCQVVLSNFSMNLLWKWWCGTIKGLDDHLITSIYYVLLWKWQPGNRN